MSELPIIKVVIIEDDPRRYCGGVRVTLERVEDKKRFTVNIPDSCWSDDGVIYGLNLVFDHSGKGDHYV